MIYFSYTTEKGENEMSKMTSHRKLIPAEQVVLDCIRSNPGLPLAIIVVNTKLPAADVRAALLTLVAMRLINTDVTATYYYPTGEESQ